MAVIGIMSAMHEELAAVLAAMPDEQRVQVAGRDFWVGHWQGHSVVAVLSRIGKVAAATTATGVGDGPARSTELLKVGQQFLLQGGLADYRQQGS